MIIQTLSKETHCTSSWCRRLPWCLGALNPDLFALHFWDTVCRQPLSLLDSSRGEEVRTFLSDHPFSEISSINEPVLLHNHVSEWACTCVGHQQCEMGQGQQTLHSPVKTKLTLCCNTTFNLFALVVEYVFFLDVCVRELTQHCLSSWDSNFLPAAVMWAGKKHPLSVLSCFGTALSSLPLWLRATGKSLTPLEILQHLPVLVF